MEPTHATKVSREEVYAALDSEREYQIQGCGNAKRHPEDPPTMTVGEYILCMEKCLADARVDWYKPGGVTAALNQLRKVAGLGVACMEYHGAPRREMPLDNSFGGVCS